MVIAAALAALTLGKADPLFATVAPLAANVAKSGPRVGLVVGVYSGGKSRAFGFGTVTTPAGESRPDGRTLFEVGSITKAFTGVLLADAEARGELKLGDPANGHLPPDLQLPGANGAAVTLTHLATHRAGLPRVPGGLFGALLAGDPRNPYADLTRDRLAKFVRDTKVDPPGKGEHYSNFGAGLAGHALTHAARPADYDTLVRERVANPLHLPDTAEALTGEQRSRLAAGFAAGKVTPHWDFATLPGCGALRSTADDLLTFARANLGEGDARVVAACRASHTERAGRIGLFWHRLTLPGSQLGAVWHNGGTAGSHSMILIVPEKKLAVVALCASGQVGPSLDRLAVTLADRLCESAPPRPPK